MQLAKLAGVSEAGLDHFYKVLRVTAQWELIDETSEGKLFSPNASTRELVRGKEASLGHFVDHQVRPEPSKAAERIEELIKPHFQTQTVLCQVSSAPLYIIT